MKRFVCIFLVLVVLILYYFSEPNNLIVFAKSNLDNCVILNDEIDEKLIMISQDELDDFLSKINLQNYREFNIEDRLIIEGYSNYINDYIIINNFKVNIQISVSNYKCLIGSPMIKQSF